MTPRKVIPRKYMPTHLPILSTVVGFLAMDRWVVNPIGYGIFYTLLVILWFGVGYNFFTEEDIDLTSQPPASKSNFAKKLDDAMNKSKEKEG